MYPDLFSAVAGTRGGRTHAPRFLAPWMGRGNSSGQKEWSSSAPGCNAGLSRVVPCPGNCCDGVTLDQRPGRAQGGRRSLPLVDHAHHRTDTGADCCTLTRITCDCTDPRADCCSLGGRATSYRGQRQGQNYRFNGIFHTLALFFVCRNQYIALTMPNQTTPRTGESSFEAFSPYQLSIRAMAASIVMLSIAAAIRLTAASGSSSSCLI